MKIKSFLWDKLLAIVFNIVGIVSTSVFIGVAGQWILAIIISSVWTVCLFTYLTVSFIISYNKIKKIKETIDNLDDKTLISAVVPAPYRLEDSLYYDLMQLQGAATIDTVTKTLNKKQEYYEYLESWVHDVKTPLAAISLICENGKGEDYKDVKTQAQKIQNLVEQILLEAKSYNLEKDLLIKKIELADVVNACIKENKQLFIDANIAINVVLEGTVLSDEKWLFFIIKQILLNCVQYKHVDNATIDITTKAVGDKWQLTIKDNGIGIHSHELPRIFDKGFTGSNGRANSKSSGLGLYLCKKLCDALELELSATSNRGEGTALELLLRQ